MLLLSFPVAEDDAIFWWHVTDGIISARGCDQDPLHAAGIGDSARVAALVPSAMATVRWFALDDALTPKQALALAEIKMAEHSIGGEDLHIVAGYDAEGNICAGTIATDKLARGLIYLQSIGIDPDYVLCAGMAVLPKGDGFARADMGFESILRGREVIVPDEASLRAYVVGDAPVTNVSAAQADDMLAMLPAAIVKARAGPNFRAGSFAKRRPIGALSKQQRKTLGIMLLSFLLLSLLIPLVQLGKYHLAIRAQERGALRDARKVVPGARTLAEAEALIDTRLAAQGRGNAMFVVPASALYSALQQTPGVTLQAISYQSDGRLSAKLAAPRPWDVNAAINALRRDGYIVEMARRQQDAAGAVTHVTLRAP